MTKTEDEILDEMETYMGSLFPRFRPGDRLTLHYLLNRSLAHSMVGLYDRIEEVLDIVDVLRATGEDLDHLVSAHLLERYEGDKATGYLSFIRNNPAIAAVIIPAGTRCQAGSLFFVTTVAGTIPIGGVSISVAATAEVRGLDGNVAMNTITTIYSSLNDVDSVTNPLAFSGGTADESDEDLRQRFIDIVTLPGLATVEMIERHLEDLENVSEAKVINHGNGDLQAIIDYSGGLTETSDEIVDELMAIVAAGCQPRGCHAAVATVGGNIEPVLDPISGTSNDTYGGYVFVRALEPILVEDSFDIDYRNISGMTTTIPATVRKGTQRGEMVWVDFLDEDERAVSIPQKAFMGAYGYDILIGMGSAGYLYELPTATTISVELVFDYTDAPEVGLDENIRDSIQNWLDDFIIGEQVEWSDVRTCAVLAYEKAEISIEKHVLQGSERPFIGIERITSLKVNGGGQSVTADGGIILLEADEIARRGTVLINGV